MTLLLEDPKPGTKRKHHFVPKFYLRNFSVGGKRIHVFNLKRDEAFENATLRDQCYRNRFHGPDDYIEDCLGEIESEACRVVNDILKSDKVPSEGTPDHHCLFAFIGLQALRTGKTVDTAVHAAHRLIDDLGEAGRAFKERLMRRKSPLDDYPGLIALAQGRPLGESLFGLGVKLLVSIGDSFAASDNPFAKYNKYLENTRAPNKSGTVSQGFLGYLPISASRALLLYDRGTYKVGLKRSRVCEITNHDVAQLNLLSVVNADTNLYYARSSDLPAVRLAATRALHARKEERVEMVEFIPAEGGLDRSLVMTLFSMPNIHLNLSILSIVRRKRGIPEHKRSMQYRRRWPSPNVGQADSTLQTRQNDDGRVFVRGNHPATIAAAKRAHTIAEPSEPSSSAAPG